MVRTFFMRFCFWKYLDFIIDFSVYQVIEFLCFDEMNNAPNCICRNGRTHDKRHQNYHDYEANFGIPVVIVFELLDNGKDSTDSTVTVEDKGIDMNTKTWKSSQLSVHVSEVLVTEVSHTFLVAFDWEAVTLSS